MFELETSAASLKNVRAILTGFVSFSRSLNSKSIGIKSSPVSEYRPTSSHEQSMGYKETFSLN